MSVWEDVVKLIQLCLYPHSLQTSLLSSLPKKKPGLPPFAFQEPSSVQTETVKLVCEFDANVQ